MTTIFAGSIFFIYVFSCIAIINYSNFNFKQKISLIYITNIGMVYVGLIGAGYSLLLLIVILYLYEEFLQTEDQDKNTIIINPIYKIIDCVYMSIFKDQVLWIVLVLLMNSYTAQCLLDEFYICSVYGSVVPLLICFHKLYAQKFKLNLITDMYKEFNKNVYEALNLSDPKVNKIFKFIAAIEDKSFFIRTNSYNWMSTEFIKYRKKQRKINKRKKSYQETKRNIWGYIKNPLNTFFIFKEHLGDKVGKLKRGYSTIEMQMIRVLGISSDFKKYVLRRKLFEILYSEIFFASVRSYYKTYNYAKEGCYKDYIMYRYIHIVQTNINNKVFKTFVDAFDKYDMRRWDMNCVAVAVLGLNSNGIYEKRLRLYEDILKEFSIDKNKVLEIADKIKKGQMTKLV